MSDVLPPEWTMEDGPRAGPGGLLMLVAHRRDGLTARGCGVDRAEALGNLKWVIREARPFIPAHADYLDRRRAALAQVAAEREARRKRRESK